MPTTDYIVKNHLEPKLLCNTVLGATEKNLLKKQHNEQRFQTEYTASHDFLTDLPNRMMFDYSISETLAHAKRNKKIFGIMFIDLDEFKRINDSLGHKFGDLLLKQVATRFQSVLREEDLVARLGGDEFGVLIREMKKTEDAGCIAEKLINSLKAPFLLGTEIINVTSSIGIATFPLAGETVSDLMRNADIAMYKAKKTEKNSFQFHSTI